MPVSHRVAILYSPYSVSATAALMLNRLAVVNCATGRNAEALVDEYPSDLAWTPDGARLVVGRLTYGLSFSKPTLVVYDAATMVAEAGWPWPADGPSVSRVAVSDAHLAVRWNTGALEVYAFASKSLVATIPGVSGTIEQMAWSPDGAYLAVATSSALYVYSVSTWGLVAGTPAVAEPYPLAWSPDGTRLAIAPSDFSNALKLYDVATWSEIPTGVTLPTRPVSVAWTADSSRIGVGLQYAPHLLVISLPGFVPQPVSMPAGVRQFPNAKVIMLPDGRVVAARESPRRVSLIAPDLQTVEYDLHASRADVSSIHVSTWLDNRLSGTVRDESDAPAAGRRVLAIHDASATVVGTATTAADGSYSMRSPQPDGHTVVLIEDGGRAQALGSGILPL
jgi:WD40 repeat protein